VVVLWLVSLCMVNDAHGQVSGSLHFKEAERVPVAGLRESDGSSVRATAGRCATSPMPWAERSGDCADESEVTSAQGSQGVVPGRASPDRHLTWAVSERVRYSSLSNQFRPGLTGNDQAIVYRTLLKSEYAWKHVTLGAELQDVRAYLTDSASNVSTALVNPLDALQAYIVLGARPASAGSRLPEVQVGRFSMELGSGRVVAQEAYRDVTRTFTGAKARWWPTRKGVLTLLAVLPTRTLPEDRDDLLHNRLERDRDSFHQVFGGLFYEREGLPRAMRADAYAFVLREHDDPGRLETRDRRLGTAGARVYRVPASGAWDFDVEAAGQWGRAHATASSVDQRALGVGAGLLHAQAGYTVARGWSPRLGVEYDYGSGDDEPDDARWNRFDGLFGNRRVELGPTGIYGALGRENIDTLGLRLSITPGPRTDAFAVYRVLRLAAETDAFASTGVRDRSGRAGRHAGQQVDVRTRIWIQPAVLRLEVGATHLIAGDFLKQAPNATRAGNTTHVYADLTYAVGSRRRGRTQAGR
jgi:hypothetical protein